VTGPDAVVRDRVKPKRRGVLLLAATLVAGGNPACGPDTTFCNACPPPPPSDPTCTPSQEANPDVVKCCIALSQQTQRPCTGAEQGQSNRCCPR
jgi:hypothetical protein